MGQIIQKNADLTRKYDRYKHRAWVGFIICGICFVCFALVGMLILRVPALFPLEFPLMVGFLGGAIWGKYNYSQAETLAVGIRGESASADLIRALPGTYRGFQNLKICYEGKISEIDMVVTGPTGVFAIETKNHNGSIYGSYEAPQWEQYKVGRGGTPYTNQIYSPIRQVGTQVYRLANLLRDNGCQVYVNSLVYFSNPEATVQIAGEPGKTPVLCASQGPEVLCRYILEHKQSIPEAQLKKINAFLTQYSIA